MDLLIKHATLILVPIDLVLSFVYLHILPKVYPFLLAGGSTRKMAGSWFCMPGRKGDPPPLDLSRSTLPPRSNAARRFPRSFRTLSVWPGQVL
jgi:hypothetical protein